MVLDDGRLVVAHAGMKEAYQGRSSARVRDFALFGETTGETDEYGLPVRVDWAADYRGARRRRLRPHHGARAAVGERDDRHRHRLRLRWPADGAALARARAGLGPGRADLLRARAPGRLRTPTRRRRRDGRRSARRRASTTRADRALPARPHGRRRQARDRDAASRAPSAIREENAAAAIEVMSRFAIDPRWLVYLPPTMAPCATSRAADLLEHPDQAFDEFAAAGVAEVVCEEKHMGSRAIVVVCRDEEAAAPPLRRRRRRDRRDLHPHRPPVLRRAPPSARMRSPGSATAVGAAGLWEELETDWLVLDCELLPWSAKALGLIREQYASVGAAARAGLSGSIATLERAAERGLDVGELDRRRALAARPGRALRRRLPPLRLAGRAASPTCASRRSTCSPPRARPSSSASTPGTSSAATASPPRAPTGSAAPTAASSTSPTTPPAPPRPPGGRR